MSLINARVVHLKVSYISKTTDEGRRLTLLGKEKECVAIFNEI